MEKYAPEHAILATNTSSISVSQIASVVEVPSRVIGMHFSSPVPVSKIIEIIRSIVKAGLLGRKTGRGVYGYEGEKALY